MTRITHYGQAGTLESSDIMITVAPAAAGDGISIELTSPVAKQYGARIREVILQILAAEGINDLIVNASDKGALDCTIRARLKTALSRAQV
jgi:citrate lyase subunit gamma (acyl carrier protein)